MLEAIELLEVAAAQAGELARAVRGQPEADGAVVVRIVLAADQPRAGRPVDQADRAVVPQQERRRDVAEGRPAAVRMAPDREQELVLGGRDAERLGLLLAPVEEAPELGAEAEEPLVVRVVEPGGRQTV